jgi:hypothetical protein
MPYNGVVERGNEMKSPEQVKKFYALNQEKMSAAQQQALQMAVKYQSDPLYFRGWVNRYFKYVEQEKWLALELHAELEVAS